MWCGCVSLVVVGVSAAGGADGGFWCFWLAGVFGVCLLCWWYLAVRVLFAVLWWSILLLGISSFLLISSAGSGVGVVWEQGDFCCFFKQIGTLNLV